MRARRGALRDLLRHRERPRRHRLCLQRRVGPPGGHFARHHRRDVLLQIERVHQHEAARVGPHLYTTWERAAVEAQSTRVRVEHHGRAARDCAAVDAQLTRAGNQIVRPRGEREWLPALLHLASGRVEPGRGLSARKLDPDLLRARRQAEEEQQRWCEPAQT